MGDGSKLTYSTITPMKSFSLMAKPMLETFQGPAEWDFSTNWSIAKSMHVTLKCKSSYSWTDEGENFWHVVLESFNDGEEPSAGIIFWKATLLASELRELGCSESLSFADFFDVFWIWTIFRSIRHQRPHWPRPQPLLGAVRVEFSDDLDAELVLSIEVSGAATLLKL